MGLYFTGEGGRRQRWVCISLGRVVTDEWFYLLLRKVVTDKVDLFVTGEDSHGQRWVYMLLRGIGKGCARRKIPGLSHY